MSDIAERVKKIVVEHLGVDADKVTDNASFIDDLGADSLDTVELVMAFEEEFGVEIPDDAAETILTVGDAVKFLEKTTPPDRCLVARSSVQRRWKSSATARSPSLEDPRSVMMRRVVVTGLGMVSPLGCGVEAQLDATRSPARAARGAIDEFEVDDLACQIACQVPRGDGSDGTFNPDDWMEPKEQRKVDDFIIYAMAAADAGARRCRLEARDAYEEQIAHRRADRLRHRRPAGHRRRPRSSCTKGPAPHQPVLHSRPADQSRSRLCLDPARPQGPEPRGGDRLLDRRARHRRRRAADRARRCRRDGRRRRRIAGQPAVARRLRRLPGAVHRLQRRAEARLASLRPRPRRLRHGRGRRRASCSRSSSTPRRAAPRSMPRSSATACPATPITSPRPPRTATAPIAAWRWR